MGTGNKGCADIVAEDGDCVGREDRGNGFEQSGSAFCVFDVTVRRVDEGEAKSGDIRGIRQNLPDIRGVHDCRWRREFQALQVSAKRGERGAIAFGENAGAHAARERFDPKGTGAGKEVEGMEVR